MMALLILFGDERKASKAPAPNAVTARSKTKKPYPQRQRVAAICMECGDVFAREPQQCDQQLLCPDKCQPIRRRQLGLERQRRRRARLRGDNQ